MSDTIATIPADRADAHYPARVATPKKRRGATLTPEEQQSIARVADAAKALEDARKARDVAHAHRIEVLRAEWDAVLSKLGAARVARELDNMIGEATVRGYTQDLRASERAED